MLICSKQQINLWEVLRRSTGWVAPANPVTSCQRTYSPPHSVPQLRSVGPSRKDHHDMVFPTWHLLEASTFALASSSLSPWPFIWFDPEFLREAGQKTAHSWGQAHDDSSGWVRGEGKGPALSSHLPGPHTYVRGYRRIGSSRGQAPLSPPLQRALQQGV